MPSVASTTKSRCGYYPPCATGNVTVTANDGSTVVVRTSAAQVKGLQEGGIFIIYDDVTALRRADQMLHEAETQYREMVESAAAVSEPGGGAHKFYEVMTDDTQVRIRYGRIGDQGQTQVSNHTSAEQAQQFAQKDPCDTREPFVAKYSRQKERFLIVPWETYRASGHYLFEYPASSSESGAPATHA